MTYHEAQETARAAAHGLMESGGLVRHVQVDPVRLAVVDLRTAGVCGWIAIIHLAGRPDPVLLGENFDIACWMAERGLSVPEALYGDAVMLYGDAVAEGGSSGAHWGECADAPA